MQKDQDREQEAVLPFGDISCEQDMSNLDDKYEDYFFKEAAFNEEALKPHIYWIIGRRGSGKSSLCQHFRNEQERIGGKCRIFQDTAESQDLSALYIDVFEPLVNAGKLVEEVIVQKLSEVWTFVIWAELFNAYKDTDASISAAHKVHSSSNIITLLARLGKAWLEKYGDKGNRIADDLHTLMANSTIINGQKAILQQSKKTPMLIAFDTLERYSTAKDSPTMKGLAALAIAVNRFHQLHANSGIQIKVFFSSEVFLHVQESALTNTLKFHDSSRNTLYLHWRPKSLLRLVCWKFYKSLQRQGELLAGSHGITEKSSYEEFLEKMWVPYFGATVVNGHGIEEPSFPYVLRHTQMRPRQLIVVCNAIARTSKETFPRSTSDVIKTTIKEHELALANEVFNAYELIYPDVRRALMWAFDGCPIFFEMSHLRTIFSTFIQEWSDKSYPLSKFVQLVSELGIVGRAQGGTSACEKSHSIIEAEFEYARKGRLNLRQKEFCVVHPIFFHTLNIDLSSKHVVYPFLPHDHPNYDFYSLPANGP